MRKNDWRLAAGLMVLLSTTLLAQGEKIGSITGLVKDESSGHALEFVNVVLYVRADSALVTGMVTDKGGKFEFGNVPTGEYYLRFGLIGYKEKTSRAFIIDSTHRKLNFGTVGLIPTTVDLDEVLVSAKKSMFNNSIDRKVYNVDQDMMSRAGSASELLQNIPSVQVDIDGTVSLRGSTGVLIMLNGKTSPLMQRNSALVLEQMPANSIERIEVITNPSAKYKPEGTAGIINIVLKKDTDLGWNGNIAVNAGNQDRYNGNARINYNPGSLNLFANYSYRKDSRNRVNSDTRTRRDSASQLSYYHEDLGSVASPIAHMVQLGADYKIDRQTGFGLSGNYFQNHFTRVDNSEKVLRDAAMAVTSIYERDRNDPEYEDEYGVTAFVEHNFPEEDHKVRAEFTSSRSPEEEDNHYTDIYALPAIARTYDNMRIRKDDDRNQLSLDYENPLGGDGKLEAGYQGEYGKVDIDLTAENFDQTSGRFVNDTTRTNRFVSNQDIHALYATIQHSFGPFGVMAGLRAEQVYRKADLLTRDTTINNDYFSLYPTLHMSYKLAKATELQLNYSRRTHRPDDEDLNPFPEYRDPRNVSRGNPALLPEYIHSVELGCQYQNDEISVLPAFFYRYTTNRVSSITLPVNDSTLLTTKENLATDRAAGVELILSANHGDIFTSHLSLNGFYNTIDASNLGYGSDKSIFTWSGTITANLSVTPSTEFQVNSNYTSARLTPQGRYVPAYVVNAGFRQEFLDGKLTLVFTAADLFKTLQRRLELDTPALVQTVVNTRDSRIFYLGLTYRFGAIPKKSKEDQLHYEDKI